MRKFCVAAICLAFCILFVGRSADALPDFKKAFDEKYTKESDNEEFKKAVKDQGCNVCHIKGKNKKERNAYGNALADLIEGDAQKRIKDAGDKAAQDKEKAKLVEEFKKALEKVEEMKIDEEKEDSETYGARLKDHKLPVEPSADDAAAKDEDADADSEK